jgi:imidazolonepropionase-like amidohydrolase
MVSSFTGRTILLWVALVGMLRDVAWSAPTSIAFIDVNVVSMGQPGLRPHQTVIVQDQRIVALGPVSNVRVPARATLITGRGRYLTPGLIDMHVHFVRRPEPGDDDTWIFPDYRERNEDYGLLFVANGVTSVRQMHGHPAGDELRARSAGNAWLGPAIYTTGPITDGDPPSWPVARIVKTPEEAARAVMDDKAAGYLGIKVYDRLSQPLYEAIVAAALKAQLDVVGHVPDAVGLAKAIAAHQATIEHTDSFVLSLQPGDEPYSEPPSDLKWRDLLKRADLSKLAAFADAMRRAGIWTCPTVVALQLDSRSNTWADEMHYVPPTFAAKLAKRYAGTSSTFEEELPFALGVVAGLHGRGAGLLLGSDAFKVNVVPGFSALEELGYLVRAGLTPFEALQAGTINAARALHQEATLGTIDVGKRADLLLLEADPLEDVRNVAHRAGVMLRGRWLTETELQARLAAVPRRFPAPSPPQ